MTFRRVLLMSPFYNCKMNLINYRSIHFVDDYSRDELRKFLQNEDVVVHHARCIIVGCGGAGKTTLLKRLEGASFKEVKDLQITESVDVHVNQFEVLENENTIKRKVYDSEIIISLY